MPNKDEQYREVMTDASGNKYVINQNYDITSPQHKDITVTKNPDGSATVSFDNDPGLSFNDPTGAAYEHSKDEGNYQWDDGTIRNYKDEEHKRSNYNYDPNTGTVTAPSFTYGGENGASVKYETKKVDEYTSLAKKYGQEAADAFNAENSSEVASSKIKRNNKEFKYDGKAWADTLGTTGSKRNEKNAEDGTYHWDGHTDENGNWVSGLSEWTKDNGDRIQAELESYNDKETPFRTEEEVQAHQQELANLYYDNNELYQYYQTEISDFQKEYDSHFFESDEERAAWDEHLEYLKYNAEVVSSWKDLSKDLYDGWVGRNDIFSNYDDVNKYDISDPTWYANPAYGGDSPENIQKRADNLRTAIAQLEGDGEKYSTNSQFFGASSQANADKIREYKDELVKLVGTDGNGGELQKANARKAELERENKHIDIAREKYLFYSDEELITAADDLRKQRDSLDVNNPANNAAIQAIDDQLDYIKGRVDYTTKSEFEKQWEGKTDAEIQARLDALNKEPEVKTETPSTPAKSVHDEQVKAKKQELAKAQKELGKLHPSKDADEWAAKNAEVERLTSELTILQNTKGIVQEPKLPTTAPTLTPEEELEKEALEKLLEDRKIQAVIDKYDAAKAKGEQGLEEWKNAALADYNKESAAYKEVQKEVAKWESAKEAIGSYAALPMTKEFKEVRDALKKAGISEENTSAAIQFIDDQIEKISKPAEQKMTAAQRAYTEAYTFWEDELSDNPDYKSVVAKSAKNGPSIEDTRKAFDSAQSPYGVTKASERKEAGIKLLGTIGITGEDAERMYEMLGTVGLDVNMLTPRTKELDDKQTLAQQFNPYSFGDTQGFWTDDQVNNYYYLREKEGIVAASEYALGVNNQINKAYQNELKTRFERVTAYDAQNNPINFTIKAVAYPWATPVMNMTAPLDYIKTTSAINRLGTEVIGSAPSVSEMSDIVTEVYTNQIGESYYQKTGGDPSIVQFLYGVYNSTAQSLETQFIGSGIASALGFSDTSVLFKAFGEDFTAHKLAAGAFSDLTFFSSAAMSSYRDFRDRGIDPSRAWTAATWAGVAEAAFEHLSFDKLYEAKNVSHWTGWLDWAKETLVSAGIEGSEEIFTSMANYLSESVILGEDSSFQRDVDAYMMQYGLDRDDAIRAAFKKTLEQWCVDGLAGFLSGGVSVGGRSAINYKAFSDNVKTQSEILGARILNDTLSDGKTLAQKLGEYYSEYEFTKDGDIIQPSAKQQKDIDTLKNLANKAKAGTASATELGQLVTLAKSLSKSSYNAFVKDNEASYLLISAGELANARKDELVAMFGEERANELLAAYAANPDAFIEDDFQSGLREAMGKEYTPEKAVKIENIVGMVLTGNTAADETSIRKAIKDNIKSDAARTYVLGYIQSAMSSYERDSNRKFQFNPQEASDNRKWFAIASSQKSIADTFEQTMVNVWNDVHEARRMADAILDAWNRANRQDAMSTFSNWAATSQKEYNDNLSDFRSDEDTVKFNNKEVTRAEFLEKVLKGKNPFTDEPLQSKLSKKEANIAFDNLLRNAVETDAFSGKVMFSGNMVKYDEWQKTKPQEQKTKPSGGNDNGETSTGDTARRNEDVANARSSTPHAESPAGGVSTNAESGGGGNAESQQRAREVLAEHDTRLEGEVVFDSLDRTAEDVENDENIPPMYRAILAQFLRNGVGRIILANGEFYSISSGVKVGGVNDTYTDEKGKEKTIIGYNIANDTGGAKDFFHEYFHFLVRNMPTTKKRAFLNTCLEAIFAGKEKLYNIVFNAYLPTYAYTYGRLNGNQVTLTDDLIASIDEEIVADLYAGITRFVRGVDENIEAFYADAKERFAYIVDNTGLEGYARDKATNKRHSDKARLDVSAFKPKTTLAFGRKVTNKTVTLNDNQMKGINEARKRQEELLKRALTRLEAQAWEEFANRLVGMSDEEFLKGEQAFANKLAMAYSKTQPGDPIRAVLEKAAYKIINEHTRRFSTAAETEAETKTEAKAEETAEATEEAPKEEKQTKKSTGKNKGKSSTKSTTKAEQTKSIATESIMPDDTRTYTADDIRNEIPLTSSSPRDAKNTEKSRPFPLDQRTWDDFYTNDDGQDVDRATFVARLMNGYRGDDGGFKLLNRISSGSAMDLFDRELVNRNAKFSVLPQITEGEIETPQNEQPEIFDVQGIPAINQKFSVILENEPTPKQDIKVNDSSVSKTLKKDNGELYLATVRELRNQAFLDKNGEFVAKYGIEEAERLVGEFNSFLDEVGNQLIEANEKFRYLGLEDLVNAKLVIDPVNNQINLDAMVPNDEYRLNFDFGTLCERRQALQKVVDRLMADAEYDENGIASVELNPTTIHLLNEELAGAGVNTQCLVCFVETKRFSQAKTFEKFTAVWNKAVNQKAKELGITPEYFNFTQGEELTDERIKNRKDALKGMKFGDDLETVVQHMVDRFAENDLDDLKLMKEEDLLSLNGRTNIISSFPQLDTAIQIAFGAGLAKQVTAFTPYNGEIETMHYAGRKFKDLASYVKSIAGVRSQSFSDFIITHVFDHLQKTGGLAAKGLTAHTYTKVLARAMLFGLTGEKINMSMLFDIKPEVDSWFAGLNSENSDININLNDASDRPYNFSDYDAYARKETDWVQSFPWLRAVELQNTPGYSKNVGAIGVALSYWHYKWMLADPEIRQIIGFHASRYPAELQPLTHIGKATDYQPVQNGMKFLGFTQLEQPLPHGVPSYASVPKDFKVKGGKYRGDNPYADLSAVFHERLAQADGKSRGEVAHELMQEILDFANDNNLRFAVKKAEGSHGDFDLYGQNGGVEETHDPYVTADNYIAYCFDKGILPQFFEFSTDPNYYKQLFDFNVFDRLSYNPETGRYTEYAPQEAVRVFDDNGNKMFPTNFKEILSSSLKDYDEQQRKTSDLVNSDKFLEKAKEITQRKFAILDEQHNDFAPVFYSKMEQAIEEWTGGNGQKLGAKMGAGSVESWLKGKGVKDEEIKWSGIRQYLEGKKSVTQEELLQVMRENEYRIETQVLADYKSPDGWVYHDNATNRSTIVRDPSAPEVLNTARENAIEEGFDPDSVYLDTRQEAYFAVEDGESYIVLPITKTRPSYVTNTHWGDYTLPGNSNYREILFKNPGNDYSNRAMGVHWKESNTGILAHARVDDMESEDGKRVLFVEEIQSDWHNAGVKSGFGERSQEEIEEAKRKYETESKKQKAYESLIDGAERSYDENYSAALEVYDRIVRELRDNYPDLIGLRRVSSVVLLSQYENGDRETPFRRHYDGEDDLPSLQKAIDSIISEQDKHTLAECARAKADLEELYDLRQEAFEAAEEAYEKYNSQPTPDAPFAGASDTYHEYVMKHLLRLAAEGGYERIGWTTAQQQSDRWSNEYAEGYRIEYDQNIPKFMKKYVKQWGATVGKTNILTEGLFVETVPEEIWSVDITPQMRDDVLFKGQPKFAVLNGVVDTEGNTYDDVIRFNYPYNKEVMTDAEHFDNYVRQVLMGSTITTLDENGEKQVIQFATDETVDKHAIPHPAISELSYGDKTGRLSWLVYLNAKEILEHSSLVGHENQNPDWYENHGWLDEGGWDKRTAYVLDKNNSLFPVWLYIANTNDGRRILYHAAVGTPFRMEINVAETAKNNPGINFRRFSTMARPEGYVSLDEKTAAEMAKAHNDVANTERKFAVLDNHHNDFAPVFYSKMQQTIEEWTNGKGQPLPAKMSAQQVDGWLKGKGVKEEEIKWSGIRQYLEGKKTVTKEELLKVMEENEYQIETVFKTNDDTVAPWEIINTTYNPDILGETGTPDDLTRLAESLAKEYADFEGYVDFEINVQANPWSESHEHEFSVSYYDGTSWTPFDTLFWATGEDEPKRNTRWDEYTLPDNKNYREVLFTDPNSEYTNLAMRTHWNGQRGVLAHARIDDMTAEDGSSVLFVEEIQSDWHNAGSEEGFVDGSKKGREDRKKSRERYLELVDKVDRLEKDFYSNVEIQDKFDRIVDKLDKEGLKIAQFAGRNTSYPYSTLAAWAGDERPNALLFTYDVPQPEIDDFIYKNILTEEEKKSLDEYREQYKTILSVRDEMNAAHVLDEDRLLLDAPYAGSSDTYHEFVMKHLLRMAAEGNYDKIGWTTAQQQSDRWSDEYAEGYRIEYDQNIPKFMRKYGKQWGATVGSTVLENGEEVWSVDITPQMKQDVLYKGQPKFSIIIDPNETYDAFGDEVEVTDYNPTVTQSDLSDKLYYSSDGNTAYYQTEDGQTVVLNNVGTDSLEAQYINYLEAINNANRTNTATAQPYTIPTATRNEANGYNLGESDVSLRRGAEEIPAADQEGTLRRTGSTGELHEARGSQSAETQGIKFSVIIGEDYENNKGDTTFDAYNSKGEKVTTADVYPKGDFHVYLMQGLREGTFEDIINAMNKYIQDGGVIEQKSFDLFTKMIEDSVEKTPEQKAELLKERDKAVELYDKMASKRADKKQDVVIPKKVQNADGSERTTRGHVRTVAANTTDAVAERLTEKTMEDELLGYTPQSNPESIRKAKEILQNVYNGDKDRAATHIEDIVNSGQMPKAEDIALGEQLIVDFSHDKSDPLGVSKAVKVTADLAILGTNLGQAVQAMSLIRKLTPRGQLYYLNGVVNQLNRQYADRIRSGKMHKVTIDTNLAQRLMMANTAEEIEEIGNLIKQNLADQIPVTVWDRWNAWRYLAMLGNPRTHIRNMIGNAAFMPVVFMKDNILRLLQLNTKWVDPSARTMSFGTDKSRWLWQRSDNPYMQYAARDFNTMLNVIKGKRVGNKFSDVNEIISMRKVLGDGWLGKLNKKNGDWLEGEDLWFMKRYYTRYLSEFLQTKGVKAEDLDSFSATPEGKALLNQARAYATQQAQRDTYHEMNGFATALNKLKHTNNASYVLLEGVAPFVGTPANILKLGAVTYSPVGLVKSVIELRRALKDGRTEDVTKILDGVASGLTGLGIMALGAILSHLGLIRGAEPSDEKEAAFEKLQGHQPWSVEIGNVSYTIDWAAPFSLPLFTGATFFDLLSGDLDFSDQNAFSQFILGIMDPMLSLSMLDGLESTLASLKYATESNGISTLMVSMLTSYVSQGMPTIFGQAARALDPMRRDNYVDKNSSVPAAVQRWIQKSIQSKVFDPGLLFGADWIKNSADNRIEYVDMWGRTEETKSPFWRVFNNFISPGYLKHISTTFVEDELERLYKAVGGSEGKAALPAYFSKDIGDKTIGKDDNGEPIKIGGKDLTGEEYEKYAKIVGQTRYQMLADMMATQEYQEATDTEKLAMVDKVYDYATSVGRRSIISERGHDASWMDTAEKFGPVDYIVIEQDYQDNKSNDRIYEWIVNSPNLSTDQMATLLADKFNAPDYVDSLATGYRYKTTKYDDDVLDAMNEMLLQQRLPELLNDENYINADPDERAERMKSFVKDIRDETISNYGEYLSTTDRVYSIGPASRLGKEKFEVALDYNGTDYRSQGEWIAKAYKGDKTIDNPDHPGYSFELSDTERGEKGWMYNEVKTRYTDAYENMRKYNKEFRDAESRNDKSYMAAMAGDLYNKIVTEVEEDYGRQLSSQGAAEVFKETPTGYSEGEAYKIAREQYGSDLEAIGRYVAKTIDNHTTIEDPDNPGFHIVLSTAQQEQGKKDREEMFTKIFMEEAQKDYFKNATDEQKDEYLKGFVHYVDSEYQKQYAAKIKAAGYDELTAKLNSTTTSVEEFLAHMEKGNYSKQETIDIMMARYEKDHTLNQVNYNPAARILQIEGARKYYEDNYEAVKSGAMTWEQYRTNASTAANSAVKNFYGVRSVGKTPDPEYSEVIINPSFSSNTGTVTPPDSSKTASNPVIPPNRGVLTNNWEEIQALNEARGDNYDLGTGPISQAEYEDEYRIKGFEAPHTGDVRSLERIGTDSDAAWEAASAALQELPHDYSGYEDIAFDIAQEYYTAWLESPDYYGQSFEDWLSQNPDRTDTYQRTYTGTGQKATRRDALDYSIAQAVGGTTFAKSVQNRGNIWSNIIRR